MSTAIKIVDGRNNTSVTAGVTSIGQLVVAPFAYDETVFNTLDVAGTAYKFYDPKPGQQFVITGVLAFADKDVADNSDTEIVVYEATSDSTATVDKTLLQFGMGKLTSIPILPLNILVNEGLFVNAKTGDDDIHMTIMGYYIPRIS